MKKHVQGWVLQANLSILICYILMGKKNQKIQKVHISVSILEKYIFFNMRPWLPGNSPMAPWGAMPPSLGTTVLAHIARVLAPVTFERPLHSL